MSVRRFFLFFSLLFLICIAFSSCGVGTKGSGDDDDSSSADDSDDSDGTSILLLNSECGAIVEGGIDYAPGGSSAEPVIVEPVASDTMVITRMEGEQAGNQQLVKLHGVTNDNALPFLTEEAIELVETECRSRCYLVMAADAQGQICQASFDGGGLGVYGQLFTEGGKSISELLIGIGAVEPVSEPCGGALLKPCYETIEVDQLVSPYVINDFLWKPVSESTGNLVVLINPYDATVIVQGAVTETLNDTGPSNGRGTTARAARPGCSYGQNVKVLFFDSNGMPILTASGEDSITIPDGCQRVERNW